MKKLDAKLAELIRVRGTKIGPEHKECFAYVSELPTAHADLGRINFRCERGKSRVTYTG